MSKPTPDQRHAALLRPTLEDAYNEFSNMLEDHKIEKPIVLADSKNLIMGLIQGNSSKAVLSTLNQKTVGLGLSTADDPQKMNPKHSKLFKILDNRLAKSPAITIWPLLREMSGCPYGIPPHLFTAQLLCYVRCRSLPSPVEIQLHPQHTVTNHSGQSLSINRITRSNVVDLRWQSGIEKYFDTLVAVPGLDWNSLQPYARLLFSDAKTASTPQEIDQQIDAFLSYIKNQLPAVNDAKTNLNTLVTSLGGTLSTDDKQLLDGFIDLFGSKELEDFDTRRKSIAPDQSTFKSAVDQLNALRTLSSTSAQIIQMYNALKDADPGTDDELSSQKELLLVSYALSSMVGNSIKVTALLNDTERFLLKLKNAQDIHTTRVKEILQKLKDSLNNTFALLEGLGKLNKVDALGPAQGHELADRFDSFLNSIEKELTGESKRHERLSYNPPEQEVKDIHQRIQRIFEKRVNLLRNQLEKAIQEQGKGDNLKTLLELLQLNKLYEVSKNLTPTIIETIKKILEEAQTKIIRSRAMDRLLDQFPALSEDDVEKFLNELRKMLEN